MSDLSACRGVWCMETGFFAGGRGLPEKGQAHQISVWLAYVSNRSQRRYAETRGNPLIPRNYIR